MANILFTNVRIFDGSGAQPYTGEVLVQGNRILRVTRGARTMPLAGVQTIDARRCDADARPGRGAHPLLLERSAEPERDPAHAHRGARALVRAHRQALSRHGLDFLRRRGCRQAAAGCGDPQCDRGGPDSRAALPRRQPGDHGARRPRRRDAAASALPRVQLRRRGERPRGDAQVRAHVPQVRRRHGQAQPVGRVHRRAAGRVHADDRRGEWRWPCARRRCAASASPPTRAPASRSSSACGTASRSSTTPASPTRRRSTCSRRTRTSTSSRPASPG